MMRGITVFAICGAIALATIAILGGTSIDYGKRPEGVSDREWYCIDEFARGFDNKTSKMTELDRLQLANPFSWEKYRVSVIAENWAKCHVLISQEDKSGERK